MFVPSPAPPYGSYAPPPSPPSPPRPMNRPDIARVALGLLGMIGLVTCAAWLAVTEVPAASGATQYFPDTAPGVPAPTPAGSTVAFDQVWTASNGDTIVAGQTRMGTSDSAQHLGAPVIRVAVTLTNNGDKEWSPVFTTFRGTLNRAPVQESGEGDVRFSTPIAPHTSVTLSKVFLGDSGKFTLAVSTPHGVALFTGQV